jgi:hypothetical protein
VEQRARIITDSVSRRFVYGVTIFRSVLLLTFLGLFWSTPITFHQDVPLSAFPIYTEAIEGVGSCVASASSTYSTSFGCPAVNPAACLCTNAASSLQVATAIRTCVTDSDLSKQQTTSATELWAHYCLTNTGVSAHDETLVDDLPLFTQVTTGIAVCVTSVTESFITSYGCTDVTKAPCLCSDPSSS